VQSNLFFVKVLFDILNKFINQKKKLHYCLTNMVMIKVMLITLIGLCSVAFTFLSWVVVVPHTVGLDKILSSI